MSELAFTTLAALADITMGQSPDSALCNTNEQGLPFLQGCAEFGQKNPRAMVFCESAVRTAKAGSVLISVRAPVGTMNYADQDYCVGRGLAAFKANPSLSNSVFLKHAVELNSGYLHRRSQGSTFAAVSSEDIRKIPVPKFSLAQQNKIAGILDGIDTTIEKTEALIEKYQQIKSGLMHDLFTRGVLPDGKLRPTREQAPELYRETGIGWVPKEWQIVALEGCLHLQSSPKNGYSPREIENWEGVYVLGLGCLTKEGFEPRQLKNAPRTAAIASGAMLNDGDFLISRANTPELVGLCGVYADVGVAAIYPDLMMRLSLVSILDARFLEAQMLYSETRIRLTALAVGTSSSMVKLNSASLKKFQLFLPALEEQKIIVGKLRIQQSLIDSEKKKLAKLRVIKNGLMHDLLTGKVAVKVDAPIEQEA